MAITATWTNPTVAVASGGIDFATGNTIDEAALDRLVSNLYYLGGADGIPILRDAAPATPVANTVYKEATAKAWAFVTISGGTPTVTNDFNIASHTDNGVGDITLNFATAQPNANYAVLVTGSEIHGHYSTKATGSVRILLRDAAHALVDGANFSVVIFGN